MKLFPERSLELPSEAGHFPVAYFVTVGMVGWVFPKVSIIDGYGLYEYVIARTPAKFSGERKIAHDRFAPHTYVASFLPNVSVMAVKEVSYRQRPPDFELTSEKIIAYEKFWDNKLVKGINIPDSLIPFPTTRK